MAKLLDYNMKMILSATFLSYCFVFLNISEFFLHTDIHAVHTFTMIQNLTAFLATITKCW